MTVIPWNFKYGEALKHYHCPECLVDLNNAEVSLRRNIERITDPQRIPLLKEAMSKGRAEQMAKTDAMWECVLEVAGIS